MAETKERAQARRDANQARQIAMYSLGHLVETMDMPDGTRGSLRCAFVATCLAGREQKVLSTLSAQVDGYRDVLSYCAWLLDEQLARDPDHFLHGVIPAVPIESPSMG